MTVVGGLTGQRPTLGGHPVQRLLLVRTDHIGDGVLASDQLRILHEVFPEVPLAVVCPVSVAGLYKAVPFPLQVIDYDPEQFRRSWPYKFATLRRIRAFGPSHCLNSMVTRTTTSDLLVHGSGAPVRIGWTQPGHRRRRDQLLDRGYTQLLASGEGHELSRNGAFLESLGASSSGYGPRVWFSPADEAWADAWLGERRLAAGEFILLFAGAQHLRGGYQGYGPALSAAFPESQIPIIAVGSGGDRRVNQVQLEAYPGPTFNLCGETTLTRLAALVGKARLAVGAETGVSHVACAVGTPQVILIGGGHFGRFHPYSPLTTLVCLPLTCYGCDWYCRYSRAHCIHDLPPAVLAEAIRSTWQSPGNGPRIFYATGVRNPGVEPQETTPEALALSMPACWVPVGEGPTGEGGA